MEEQQISSCTVCILGQKKTDFTTESAKKNWLSSPGPTNVRSAVNFARDINIPVCPEFKLYHIIKSKKGNIKKTMYGCIRH
jgi:hypothetical protein